MVVILYAALVMLQKKMSASQGKIVDSNAVKTNNVPVQVTSLKENYIHWAAAIKMRTFRNTGHE